MLGLALAIDVVGGLGIKDQRQVQYIEPNYRILAIMPVLVPHSCGSEDQITATHGAFLAVDVRPGTFALDHHAHGVRRMPV
jgi:hypothetical protein